MIFTELTEFSESWQNQQEAQRLYAELLLFLFGILDVWMSFVIFCTVPKYRAAVDYTPRLRAPRNLPRCTANSDTRKAVANHSLGSATANSYLGTTST